MMRLMPLRGCIIVAPDGIAQPDALCFAGALALSAGDQWAEVATAGQLDAWLEQHPRSVIALFSRFARAAAGAAPRRAWQPEPPQWRALEPCKNRHGRVGAVAEYMLAALGVPATGLSRTKGIVAWTGPGGY
jgi:hypothetical protein